MYGADGGGVQPGVDWGCAVNANGLSVYPAEMRAKYSPPVSPSVDWEAEVKLRLVQLADELAILRSPRGADYVRFSGETCTVENAIASIELEMAGLRGAL